MLMRGAAMLVLAAAVASAAAAGPRGGEVAAALRAPEAERREAALDRLIAAPDASPAILRQVGTLLDDADGYVAGKAATALGRAGKEGFSTLDPLLAEGTAQQRWGATLALHQSKADIAPFLPQLARQLSQDDERLVHASLAALARLQARAAPALPALPPLLSHPRAPVRWATLETLGAIGAAAHGLVPQVTPLLQDPEREVRLAAAMALQRIVPPAPLTDERLAGHLAWLQEHVPALMREHQVPGVSIAIIQGGRVRWAEGFGVSDVRHGTPVTTDTVFEACSMSKPILALAAMQLVQHGKLDLDQPLARYLGTGYLGSQPGAALITARMALTHRTGLPNWRVGEDEMGGPLPVQLIPGTEYTYSGEGVLLLQRAMEAITGVPLEHQAQRGLFAPLGLGRTDFAWSPTIEETLASGHRNDGTFKARTRYRKGNGAYSLYTTPSEYARLMLTVLSPETLGRDALTGQTIDAMLQPALRIDDAVARPGLSRSVGTYRALGWIVEVTAEGMIAEHSGSNSSGFRAFAQFNRAKGSGLVIMMNGDNGLRVREAIIAQVGDL